MVAGTGLLVVFTGWLGKLIVAGVTLMPAGVFVPFPDNETLCAMPPLSSAIVMVAERAPIAAGVNLTGMVRVPPFAATETGVDAVVEKSLPFGPVKFTEMICIAEAVLFVTVISDAALAIPTDWSGKTMLSGDTVIPPVPVAFPVSATECGLPVALSANSNVVVREPEALGANMTGIDVELLAATIRGAAGVGGAKFSGNMKSFGFVPPKERLVINRGPLPELVTVKRI
jgi:hypothetical protein